MINEVYMKIREYEYYHGKIPNAIYVGHDELDELLWENKRFLERLNNEELKFCGINLMEVNKKNYLKVGYVE